MPQNQKNQNINPPLLYLDKKFNSKGSHDIKKTVKKGHIVPFQRTSPLDGQKGHICCLKRARKSRQMRFRDKIAYIQGIGYGWDPSL